MSQPGQLCRENAAPCDLAGILYPADAEAFLAGYGERFQYVPGTPGKFAGLLPWSALNRILEDHRLESPRLRLTREGKPVAQDGYISFQTNRRKNAAPIPRLDSASLTRELREGATLVLDAVDDLHQPVRRLAEAMERVFRVRVQVNAYAGWRTSHGFDLHWDDHDVFVLQVAGRKHWKVYGITRPFPLSRDVDPAKDPPSKVLWDGLLQDGDLLYIPRGWWHVAVPLDEPTLHLTVGVNNLTGADFLVWFAKRMKRCETIRRDIPHLAGAESQRAFAQRLRDAVVDELRPELIDEFLLEMDSGARPRPHFALPWTAMPEVLPQKDFRVYWHGNRRVRFAHAEDTVTIDARGRRWRFASAALPLLERIVSGREQSLADLCAGTALAPEVVRAFVSELAANGLVIIV